MRSSNTFVAIVIVLANVGGCVDMPPPDIEPQARLIAAWDPLDCGEPHRVVFELEDERGASLSRSTWCRVGGLSIDVPHWGIYRGRIYAWQLNPGAESEIRSEVAVRIEVDSPIVHWFVDTPR
jgi:hypothetical protein